MKNKITKTLGRRTKYKKEYVHQASILCKLGATDDNLAEFFCVTDRTIDNWKKAHNDFFRSLKESKSEFDNKIEKTLAQRAMGYSHPEEKIFNYQGKIIRADTTKHYPPDTTACIFWLKNRNPDRWREKQKIIHDTPQGGGVLMVPNIASFADWAKINEENELDLKEKEKMYD